MVVRACGWAFYLGLVPLDAGTLNGSKEAHVSRAQRLLFMVDATGLRFMVPTASLWYPSWLQDHEPGSASWLVG